MGIMAKLKKLQKERLIVARLGFPDKAMEIDEKIEQIRADLRVSFFLFFYLPDVSGEALRVLACVFSFGRVSTMAGMARCGLVSFCRKSAHVLLNVWQVAHEAVVFPCLKGLFVPRV